MSLTLRYVDWGQLVAQPTLCPQLSAAVRDVLAGRGGVSVNDVDIDLSPGSVHVIASVQLAAAGGDDAEQQLLERLGPPRSLSDAVTAKVANIDGISAATTGNIHVEDVELGKSATEKAWLDMRWLILGVLVTTCFCCCSAPFWLRNWVARPGYGQRTRTTSGLDWPRSDEYYGHRDQTASGHDWRRSEEHYRPVRSLDGLDTTRRHEAWSSEAHRPRARGHPKREARASETKAYGWALHQSPEEYNPNMTWSNPPTREGSVHIANEIRQDLGAHAISPLIDLGQEPTMPADPLLQMGSRGSSFTRQQLVHVRGASGSEGASRASSAATSFALSAHSRAASFQHAGQGCSHTSSSFPSAVTGPLLGGYHTGAVPRQAMRGTVLEPTPPYQTMRGTVLEPTPPTQWAVPTPVVSGAGRTVQVANHLLQVPQPLSDAAAVRTGHYRNGSQPACAMPTGDVVQRMLRG